MIGKGVPVESYITVRPGEEPVGEFIDRKSRFIAQLAHVETEDEASAHIAAVRARHHDARHNVPVWILANGTERASDDGEPQRTAGVPTLEVLRGEGLRDVCCVTTRYFGGTLLGTGGLVRAYTQAAQEAVEVARSAGQLVQMTSVIAVDARVGYALYEQTLRAVAAAGGKVRSSDFTDAVTVHAVFRAGDEAAFLSAYTELTQGGAARVGEPRFDEF